MNDLEGFSKGLDAAAERRRREREELQVRLGEPDAFLAYSEDPRFGVGYWKIAGGVVSYRKYVNGYDPLSRFEFTDDLIALLNRVQGMPPRSEV